MSKENGISLSEASKLSKRTLAPTFNYSGRHYKSDKERNYKLQIWNTWEDINSCLLNHFCGLRPALQPPILMEMESCQNWSCGLQEIKQEASVNKSGALTGQSGWFLLSDYMNDIKVASTYLMNQMCPKQLQHKRSRTGVFILHTILRSLSLTTFFLRAVCLKTSLSLLLACGYHTLWCYYN